MYRKSSLCIETMDGLLVVDGWALDNQDWNGWAIPLFDKVAADAIAEYVGLVYNKETDTYTETDLSAGEDNYRESWKGGLNEKVNEHIYSIGAMYWTWSIVDEDELKDLDIKIIDRRVK